MQYQHQKVFIAGGSSGIGFAIAKAFAAAGADVIIFARTVSNLEIARDRIIEYITGTQRVGIYNLDATDHSQVKLIMEQAMTEYGVPDILVNCVGIAQPGYFENISASSFDQTLKTNLYSTWNVCSAVLPHMKLKGGHILNTSSIAGFIGVYGYTDYCMAKFGIIGFSEALRSELKAFNIFVSVLCPPDTDTPGYEIENATKPEETKAISGNAKLLKPEFVAEVVLKQLPKNQFMIIPGTEGKFSWILKRFFPSLVEKFMDRAVRKVRSIPHS